jgi:competence protein ComEA
MLPAQPQPRAGRRRGMGVSCRLVPPAAATLVVLAAIAGAPPARAEGKRVEGVVNLNTAPPELLGLLPGVGPSKARGILAYRGRRAFRTVDELVRVKGIGRRMVRELRKHLAVAGPTTIRALTGPSPEPPPPLPPPAPLRPRTSLVAGRPLLARPVSLPARAPPRPRWDRPARSPANACLPPP